MVRFPETKKRPGVYYAMTRDGVELPVIDVTNPAFALNVSDTEQRTNQNYMPGVSRDVVPSSRDLLWQHRQPLPMDVTRQTFFKPSMPG